MEKYILKNNRLVNISFLETRNKFMFCASNHKNEIVGKCVFSIENCELKILNTKTLIKCKNILDGSISCIHPNKEQLKVFNIIKQPQNICFINEIEITDKDFFKKGLGTLLMKKTEEFANSLNCSKIFGWFYPNGEFWYGAKEFYAKNGFKFINNNNQIFISKEIEASREKN